MFRVDGVVWAFVAGRGPLWGLFLLTQQGTKSLWKNLTSHWDIKATPPCHANDMGLLKSWKHFWVLNKLYFSRLMCGVDGVVWALVAGRGPLWGLFFLTQQGTKSLLKNLTSHWDIKATPPPCHASDMKSVNLQYITLGCLDDGTNESSTKRLMF